MPNSTFLLENGRIDKYLFPKGYVKAYYFGNIGHRIKGTYLGDKIGKGIGDIVNEIFYQ